MPSIEKRELERMAKRIMQIYEQLDGKLDDRHKSLDEFSRLQISIKEDFVFLRESLQRKHNMQDKGEINMQFRQLDQQIKTRFGDTQQKFGQLERLFEQQEKNPQMSN